MHVQHVVFCFLIHTVRVLQYVYSGVGMSGEEEGSSGTIIFTCLIKMSFQHVSIIFLPMPCCVFLLKSCIERLEILENTGRNIQNLDCAHVQSRMSHLANHVCLEFASTCNQCFVDIADIGFVSSNIFILIVS